MSPFAAGCAVCGADLDTKRWDTGPSAINRAGSWFSALSNGGSVNRNWIWLIIFIVFFLTPLLAYFGFYF
ncbi:hypothetical protein OJ997_29245 [Solirubrobacter phytolaccae]|uniref:Uncharacterized protein n=1 Tax=Solirubrobacter phytolaccae TaxID=1404360 RepID=A0A9X3NE48_9ACTN|nr:hypothetical protein [Solirubrobacter phytolaccae]MDA0184426.1 hypothetical protein [Solirubrobacter phytolaccae]